MQHLRRRELSYLAFPSKEAYSRSTAPTSTESYYVIYHPIAAPIRASVLSLTVIRLPHNLSPNSISAMAPLQHVTFLSGLMGSSRPCGVP